MSDQIPEEPILTGRPASVQDAFWTQKMWELEAEGPAVLTQASRQMMSMATFLSGIYLATLGLLGVKELADLGFRVLSLIPYLAWLPAFFFAYLAHRPQRTAVAGGDAVECRAMILRLSTRKRRWSHVSELLLLGGLVAAVIWVGVFFIQGSVPQPSPPLTGQGG